MVLVAPRRGGIDRVIKVAIIGRIFITRARRVIEIVDATIGGSWVELVLRAGGRRFDIRSWGVRQIAVAELGIEKLYGDMVCDRRNMSIDWTRFR